MLDMPQIERIRDLAARDLSPSAKPRIGPPSCRGQLLHAQNHAGKFPKKTLDII